MCRVNRLIVRLTRVPCFLFLLLHLFCGSTWYAIINRGGDKGRQGKEWKGGAGEGGGGLGFAWGQEFPSRDEDHFQFMLKYPEFVFDSKSLPDGKEEIVYLQKGKSTRFFFLVENESPALTLIVSPCSSKVTWRFWYLFPFQPDENEEEQDAVEEEDVLKQTADRDHNRRLLKSYTGSDVSGFDSSYPHPGLYSLVIINRDRSGTVRIFASTSGYSDSPFPLPPSDPSIRIIPISPAVTSPHGSNDSTSSSSSPSSPVSYSVPSPLLAPGTESLKFRLSWQKSPTEEMHRQPVEYCLSINTVDHVKTLCAVSNVAERYPSRSSIPLHHTIVKIPKRVKARRGPERKVSSGEDHRSRSLTMLTCVGSKTSFTFSVPPSTLLRAREYYIDVFAVNRRTNSSVTYKGVKLRLVGDGELSSSEIPYHLKDGEPKEFNLKVASTMSFKFRVSRDRLPPPPPLPPLPLLVFAIRACVGQVRVEISRDWRNLYENSTSGEILLFRKTNPDSGTYRIRVSNDGRIPAKFQILVTSSVEDFPYPLIPDPPTVELLESTCRSLSVAWSSSNPENSYCLLVEPVTLTLTPAEPLSRCSPPRPVNKKSKVICYQSKSANDQEWRENQQVEKNITDLEPGLVYRVTVHARYRNGSDYVSYPSLVTETESECPFR